jgi:hypothetical protein
MSRPSGRGPPSAAQLDAAWEEWDENVEFLAQAKGGGRLLSQLSAAKSRVPVPDSVSAVEMLIVDRLNHVWVGHRLDADTEYRTWAVFRDDGVLLGELQIPAAFDIHEIGYDYILGVTRDQFGVPYVELITLTRSDSTEA